MLGEVNENRTIRNDRNKKRENFMGSLSFFKQLSCILHLTAGW
jgi:hypothetical protein